VLDRAIRHECLRMRAEVLAFGGVADHVHVLVRVPAPLSVSELVKQVKGSTSHMIQNRLKVPFKWQGGYGAFTVLKRSVPAARDYILRQREHHASPPPNSPCPRLRQPPGAPRPRRPTQALSPRRRTSRIRCSEFIRPSAPADAKAPIPRRATASTPHPSP
jgi:hypothetical protein